jgi:SAM-dependent methyltransferase
MSDAPADTRSPHFTQDSTAQRYRDIQMPRIFVPWAKILLDSVTPRPGDAVLDVATGPGTVARQAAVLVGPAGKVTGVDISAAMLSVGRSWPREAGAAPIEYVEAPAASMPLPDAAFDAVYCQQGMQHMSDPHAALREMRRLLKPGGTLGLAAWTESPFAMFRKIVGRFVSTGGSHSSDFGQDPVKLELALCEAGFHDVRVQTRELTSVFDGGVPEALQVAQGTSMGPVIDSLSAADQEIIRKAISQELEKLVTAGAVHLKSGSNIASARG